MASAVFAYLFRDIEIPLPPTIPNREELTKILIDFLIDFAKKKARELIALIPVSIGLMCHFTYHAASPPKRFLPPEIWGLTDAFDMDEFGLSLYSRPILFSRVNGYTNGLIGLRNCGNTCFMNAAIQCLAHTPKLVDYFLRDFRNNSGNGELAIVFRSLLLQLQCAGQGPVSPRLLFKSAVASQFRDYRQHDFQEFLLALLNGLHEALKRVNSSIIVDLCQGQCSSTIVCPVCKKLSVSFDMFMDLSLSLPSEPLRNITLTVMSIDRVTLPCQVTVTVPIDGTFKHLVEVLTKRCSLREDETLVIAKCAQNEKIRFLEDPTFRFLEDGLVNQIEDSDILVAGRWTNDYEPSYSEMQQVTNRGNSELAYGVLCQLPKVCPVSLYKCVETFLEEKPLGPDEMWLCPNCKEHSRAKKKLDLLRLPEILIVHLKRFSDHNNKLDSLVYFPIDEELDLSRFIKGINDEVSNRYVLYAVSNHYGCFERGHYTAFLKLEHSWYEFNDSNVLPIDKKIIKTAAAYVLFYRRV